MQQRRLGEFSVSALGLGCMNLSHAYGTPPPPEQANSKGMRNSRTSRLQLMSHQVDANR